MWFKKQQLELYMEKFTGSKLEKERVQHRKTKQKSGMGGLAGPALSRASVMTLGPASSIPQLCSALAQSH